MGTMEQKLSYLLQTKSAIREAIQNRGVEITDDDTFRSYAKKINDIQGKVYYLPAVPSKQGVDFRDCDGAILHSYTKDEFLALTEMPALPERPKLICQEWNWSLEDAKAYVEEYGVLDIGATYITDDGKTRLYISLAHPSRRDVPLYFDQTTGNGVVVDWGDGSSLETFSTTRVAATHHYDKIGEYIITLEVINGKLQLANSSYGDSSILGYYESNYHPSYTSILTKVEIGSGVTNVGSYAFYSCHSLSEIIIPSGVTSNGISPFFGCSSLPSIVFPKGTTKAIFGGCDNSTSVMIPNGVTSINLSNDSSVKKVIIPNGVTTIDNNAFYENRSLKEIVIPNGVISIGNNAFDHCYSLSEIIIPSGVTSIGNNVFRYSSLNKIIIPDSVISIGDYAFEYCRHLIEVAIPNSVTKIASNTFSYCSSLAIVDFSSHTSVPTLANTYAFSSVASDLKIVVPDALYDEWIAATNWSSSSISKYIVKASVFNG